MASEIADLDACGAISASLDRGPRPLVGRCPGDGVRHAPSRPRLPSDPRQHGAGIGRGRAVFRQHLRKRGRPAMSSGWRRWRRARLPGGQPRGRGRALPHSLQHRAPTARVARAGGRAATSALHRGGRAHGAGIEQRLYDETWSSRGYDLIPKLRALDIPTLVLHGEDDFVPLVARRPHRARRCREGRPSCSRSVRTSRIWKLRTRCTRTWWKRCVSHVRRRSRHIVQIAGAARGLGWAPWRLASLVSRSHP